MIDYIEFFNHLGLRSCSWLLMSHRSSCGSWIPDLGIVTRIWVAIWIVYRLVMVDGFDWVLSAFKFLATAGTRCTSWHWSLTCCTVGYWNFSHWVHSSTKLTHWWLILQIKFICVSILLTIKVSSALSLRGCDAVFLFMFCGWGSRRSRVFLLMKLRCRFNLWLLKHHFAIINCI